MFWTIYWPKRLFQSNGPIGGKMCMFLSHEKRKSTTLIRFVVHMRKSICLCARPPNVCYKWERDISFVCKKRKHLRNWIGSKWHFFLHLLLSLWCRNWDFFFILTAFQVELRLSEFFLLCFIIQFNDVISWVQLFFHPQQYIHIIFIWWFRALPFIIFML